MGLHHGALHDVPHGVAQEVGLHHGVLHDVPRDVLQEVGLHHGVLHDVLHDDFHHHLQAFGIGIYRPIVYQTLLTPFIPYE